jgi:autotransporter-associated beta strand protein
VLAGGSVTSATGLLTLSGNLTSTGSNAASALLANLRLGNGPRTFTILAAGGASDLTISNPISGLNTTSALIKEGPGILLLSAANTFAAGITLNAGTLKLGDNAAAGPGLLVLSAGTLQADTAARTLANPVNLNGSVTFGGTLDLTFNGPAVLTANSTVTVNNTTTFANFLSENTGGRTLTKAGSGTLVLSQSNPFSGGFTLSSGTLRLGNDGSSAATCSRSTAARSRRARPRARSQIQSRLGATSPSAGRSQSPSLALVR